MKKKYLIALLALLLVMILPVAVYAAEGENQPVEEAEVSDAVTDGADAETPAGKEYASETWVDGAKKWIAENFAGIMTALAALYAVFPKYGGIAALLGVMRSTRATINSVRRYMDDTNNENSIYNTLKKHGDTLSRFLNDIAPVLEKLEEGLTDLEASRASQDKLKAALLAVEAGQALMAKQFSDLISISTTIPQKKKAELEAAWMEADAQLREAVKEAVDDGEKEETAA